MYWKLVTKADVRARLMADRHYSRQTPGAKMFTPPGQVIVLLGLNDDALWVSQRPAPTAGLDVRRDGFTYWHNVIFRNESGLRSSDLIQQALAVSVQLWRDALPRDGFHSFTDPNAVTGVKHRSKMIYGYCFMKAGFELHPERTKERGLWRWILPLAQLRAIEPQEPNHEQIRLMA